MPWCTNKPDSNPKQQAVQEATKKTAKLARPHNSRPGISVPSWAASTCRPVSLALPTHLPILQDLDLPIPHPLVKLAGRTAEHLAAWKKITSNQWVLQAVKWVQVGVHLTTTTVSQTDDCAVRAQSSSHLRRDREDGRKGSNPGGKGQKDGWFFLQTVSKKEGQMRPVLNLKPLNEFIYHRHFKMEGMHIVRDLLQRGNWMTRIDIKDAYFAIPIHPQHQKFLRF